MSDEIHETPAVEVTRATVAEEVTISDGGPVVDWENPPQPVTVVSSEQIVVSETAVAEPAVAYAAPRGTWDFTDTQRIVLALLIWLNLMMLGLGYLALTGRL